MLSTFRSAKWLCLIVTALSLCAVAGASPMVTLLRDDYLSGLSLWEYEYEIVNDEPLVVGNSIADLNIANIDYDDIVNSPTGWDFIPDNRNNGSAYWYATSASYYVGPQQSLAQFTIQSPAGPAADIARWDMSGWAENKPQVYEGYISGPDVPEPSTWALMLAGLVGLVVVRLRRRARTACSPS